MKYKRIISLTPSITEVLFAIGAEGRVVGVTDACDYPPGANSKKHVCSWFDPDMDRITNLEPDLILGLTTVHKQLALLLEKKGFECILVNPATVEEALSDMLLLGDLLEQSEIADTLVKGLRLRMKILAAQVAKINPDERLSVSRVLDIEGENLIVAGPKSFQYDVIRLAGGNNVTTGINEAYPNISFQNFRIWDPDMIFLCGSERSYLSRLQADSQWQTLTAIRSGRIYLFDCGLTCRTGPRIVDMAELLFQTLYA